MSRSPSSPRRTLRRSTPAALLVLALVPATSSAMSLRFFHTPSGNIHCLYLNAHRHKSLRCDVYNATNTPPARPAGCPFDYGFAFGLRPHGHARRLCVSDAVDAGSELSYGSSIKRFGIKCSASTSGLRCRNRSGHGFKLAIEAQKLF